MSKSVLIEINGRKEWRLNGLLHRTDGPAIEWAYGVNWWYVNGIRMHSYKSFQKAAKLSDEDMAFVVLKHSNIL